MLVLMLMLTMLYMPRAVVQIHVRYDACEGLVQGEGEVEEGG